MERSARAAKPPCPRCGGLSKKAGFVRGEQRYYCKEECRRYYTLSAKDVRRLKARAAGAGLLKMIEKEIAPDTRPDVREEIIQEMALAALEGYLDLASINQAVPFYRRKVLRQTRDRFKLVSLDQPIGDEGGLTVADLLAG